MNKILEALAEGTTTLDDCTTGVLQFARKLVRNFLNVYPMHGYLKDDLVGSASLSIVVACQRIQQGGDLDLANTNYLSTCVWNGLSTTVRLEQTITPPKEFNKVLGQPEDMPSRAALEDIAVDHWCDEQREKAMVSDLNLTEVEREVLDHRMAGCKKIEVAKAMGFTMRELGEYINSIKEKWESQ
jgi:hypothetical protein